MKSSSELFLTGRKLYSDSFFVKDKLLKAAWDDGRWNIVLFEAYRASELLIKGLINLSGLSFRPIHELDKLLIEFKKNLLDSTTHLPFIYSLSSPNKDGYMLRVIGEYIELYKRVGGVYTLLGCGHDFSKKIENIQNIRLIRNGVELKIVANGKELFSQIDGGVTVKLLESKITQIPPSEHQISSLNNILVTLRKTREKSFYNERTFSKEEAAIAIELLENSFSESQALIVRDHV